MLTVETGRSDGGGEEPRVIWFGARRVDVLEVVDRWYAPGRRWWKLRTAEGQYILRRDLPDGAWELAAVVGE